MPYELLTQCQQDIEKWGRKRSQIENKEMLVSAVREVSY